MNNFYSADELYYTRWLTDLLQEALNTHPVLVLTGARQVGKSTLLNNALPFSSWRYHTLDNLDTLAQAQHDAHPNAQGGILLHQGTTVRYLHERILAIPWTLLAG